MAAKSKIVQATGVAVSHDGTPEGIERAKSIEAAMVQAIEQANKDGVTDPVEVRARILAARDAVTS
jgi:hypothetical protein